MDKQSIRIRYAFVTAGTQAVLNWTYDRPASSNDYVRHPAFPPTGLPSGGGPGTNTMHIVPWAGDIRWDGQPATAITLTSDRVVVERNHGFRVRDLSLSGEVGPMPWLPPILTGASNAYNHAVKMPALDDKNPGGRSYVMLRRLAELFEFVAKDPDLQLHLFALDEGWYYVVEPQRVSMSRGGRNKTGMRYDLHVKVLGTAEAPKLNLRAHVLPAGSWWKGVQAAMADALAYCNGLVDGLREIAKVVKAIEHGISDVLRFVEDLVNVINDAANVVIDVLHAPERLWNNIKRIKQAWDNLVQNLKSNVYYYFKNGAGFVHNDPGDGIAPVVTPGSVGISAASMNAVFVATDSIQYALDKAFLAARDGVQQQFGQVKQYPVQASDTIEAIALKSMGAGNLWPWIVQQNHLVAPYVSASGLPGTVRPGDRIMVPAAESGTDGTLASGDAESLEDRAYGRDLRLDSSFDFVMTPDGGDLDVVSGVDNVTTAIRVRIRTDRQGNILFPTVGLPPMLGNDGTAARLQQAAACFLWELKGDDRVATVKDFRFVDGGNRVEIEATAVLLNAEQVLAQA